MNYNALDLIIFLILGLVIGSFINVFLYRYPKTCQFEWQKEAHEILNLKFTSPEPISYMKGRSQCPHCQHTLTIIELIPIMSYLFLSGRCHHCHNKISRAYPIIEIIAGILAITAVLASSSIINATLLFAIFLCLLTIFMFDLQNQWIPDGLNYLLLGFSLIFTMQSSYLSLEASVIGMLSGYLSIYLIRWFFLVVRNIEAIGLGDAKLLAALGAWLGVVALPMILLLSSLMGILVFVLTTKNAQQKIAFGPFLVMAGFLYFGFYNL